MRRLHFPWALGLLLPIAQSAFAQEIDQPAQTTTSQPMSAVAITLLVAWLAVIVFVLWRAWPRFFDGPAAVTSEDNQIWLDRVLPMVRVRMNASFFWLPLTRRDEVVVLYRDEILQLRKRRRAEIDPAAYRIDGAEDLKKSKRSKIKRAISLASVNKVVLKRPWVRGFLLGQIRLKFYSGKKTTKIFIVASELPNVLHGLEILLPGLVILPPEGKHKWFKQKKKAKDLSQRRPFRSRAMSVAIKFAALGIAVSGGLYLLTHGEKEYLLVVYVLLVGLLQIANGLWERDPMKLLGSDRRRPILYLRSFLDDRETSLHPETAFSALVGLDPPFYSLEQYRDARFYKFARSVMQALSNHHPVRLLKLLIGRPLDTSEEQVSSFFARLGTFIAIGKPGERFATTGAARTYVGNDEWQDVVLTMLRESQVILLQPSSTEGVWWEVEQALKIAEPWRVLMCLVNYRGRQNDYETFRQRLEKFLPPGVQVPRAIGNDRRITFLYFDQHWQPQQLKLVYYSRFAWPFRMHAVDLDRTLQPFLRSCGIVDAGGKLLPSPQPAVSAGD